MPPKHIQDLMEDLCKPSVYPHEVDCVERIQTHISVVFLAGGYAYKLKKPLDLGFLDYTTLDKRLDCCEQEVRLNRRLAPTVYCGVVPIRNSRGSVCVGQEMDERDAGRTDKDLIECAVKMVRLPSDRTFRSLLSRGELTSERLDQLAQKLVAFYAAADAGGEVSRMGDWPMVARNCQENFEQIAPFVGQTLSAKLYGRLGQYTEVALQKHRSVVEKRARENVPRDTHGDLRLEHAYAWAKEGGLPDVLVVDCIEFNKRFRYADPVSDIAFLAMELEYEGRPDLSQAFTESYFRRSGDLEGLKLLPFYIAYRHVVRGKVCSLKARQEEVPRDKREEAEARARRHFLGALGRLAPPEERPCLILVGGLPGVGKSTVARLLEERVDFVRLSSDRIRKQLAGLPESSPAGAPFEEGIHTPAWTNRTYAELRRQAMKRLFQGDRVLVDASFRSESHRKMVSDAAKTLGVPALFLFCRADRDVVRRRLESREEGPSDANWDIYCKAAQRWEAVGPDTGARMHRISTQGSPDAALSEAVKCLAEEGCARAAS
jgi:aminoglycoside phosphotransferase family enzyme/predicted kinase